MNKGKGKISAFLMILVIGMLTISTFTLTIVPTASVPPIQLGTTQYPWPQYQYNLSNIGYNPNSPAPPTNRTLWVTEMGNIGMGGPTVADGIVFSGNGWDVSAFNMTTGAFLWNFTTGGTIRSAPAVADGLVFIGSNDGYLYCINETTGLEKWRYSPGTGRKLERVSPAVHDGKVFFGSVGGSGGDPHNVTCLTTARAFVWNYTIMDQVRGCPAIVGGLVYIGAADDRVYCLNETTGKQVWNYTTGGDIRGSPAVAGGLVFFGSNDDKVYAITAGKTGGNHVWNYSTASDVRSTPAVAYGKVFIGSLDGKVYCLNATSATLTEAQRLIWSYQTAGTQGGIRGPPAIANSLVFIGSFDDGQLYAFGALGGPVASFTFSPAVPKKDEVITFDASGSSPGSNGTVYVPIANYTWNFDDGNVTVIGDNEPLTPIITHSYSVEKSYNVTLNVTDIKGVSDIASANVTVAIPPIANSTFSPTDPRLGEVVTFNASKSNDPDGVIVSYTWDFGDGTPTVTENDNLTTHIYTLAGTHTVTLTVTDNQGFTGSMTQDINVTAVLGTTEYPWSMFHYDLNNTGYNPYSPAPNLGLKLWNRTCGNIGAEEGTASPVVVNGTVLIGSQDNNLYCLNMTTGAVVWTFTTGDDIVGSPAVADGKVFFGSIDTYVYCLNQSMGLQLWRYKTDGPVRSSPAVADGKVYIGSNDGKLYCLTTAGVSVWNYTIGDVVISSPAVAGDLIFVGSYDNKLYCINMTGGLEWSYTTGHDVTSSPAVFGDKVFFGSKDGTLYCINMTGGLEWSYTTGDRILSSPAVANNKVFVGDDSGNITCLTTAGAYVWNYTTGAAVTSSPAVADGKVFVGSWDNKTYALNMTTGAVVWTYITEGEVRGSPAVANSTVFIGSRDQNVYALTDVGALLVVTNVTIAFPLGASAVYPMGNWYVDITVVVENQGGASGTFDVTANYSNETYTGTIGTQTRTLNPGQNTTVQFTWNVAGVSPCTYIYTTKGYVPYNITISVDNTVWPGGNVTVRMLGDCNGDGHCDYLDLGMFGASWSLNYGHPNYLWQADFDGDGTVGFLDLGIFGAYWYRY